MGNVLGELFGDIAAAIREKTGDTATMKPAEFPENIRGLQAGGGVEIQVKSGSFTPTGTLPERVSINFGFKPDFLIVYLSSESTSGDVGRRFVYWGYSSAFADKYGFRGQMCYYLMSGKVWNNNSGAPIDGETGAIHSVDETGITFDVMAPIARFFSYRAFKLT